MSGSQLYSRSDGVYRLGSQQRSTSSKTPVKLYNHTSDREKWSESSTPHAPRPRRPTSSIQPQKTIKPYDQQQQTVHHHKDTGKSSKLTRQDYDENSPPEGVTTATKQPIGSVKHAWSNESPATPKIVQPYRRTIGRLAPHGVPLLDLSALNEPDDHLQPVQLLQPSTTDFPSHRSLISWDEHTCLATPNDVRVPPCDHMTPPDDHMIPPPDHSAMTDIEADLEPILVHQGSRSSSPAANKLPQAIALQDSQLAFIEAKLMSNERAKPVLETNTSPQTNLPPPLPGGASAGLLKHRHPPAPSHQLMHTTSMLIPEPSLNKRLRFEARVLTQNGRDVHRELCGFYFLADNSITVYEYRQFGKKSSALPVIQRGCYTHLIGHRKGQPLEINFIRKGSVLHFRVSDHPCLPSSLRETRQLVAMMITNVDERTKKQLLCEGRNPVEHVGIEAYLNQEPSAEEQRDTVLLATLQDMLSSCVKGRARKTLIGVGRELRRLSSSDGIISKPHLLQVLRKYHLGLTVEDMDRLYQLLVTMETTPPSGCGLYVDGIVSVLVGRISEDRLALIRQLYRRLDAQKSGSISLDQCNKFFNKGLVPGRGQRSTAEAWDELMECLFSSTSSITYADLEHYYHGISIETDSDSEFYSLLRLCWTL